MKKFNEEAVLHRLKHYLPAQSPLKDFVHHNTLHAFQDQKYEQAIRHASKIFGYKVSLSLEEYRKYYKEHLINDQVLINVIAGRKGAGTQNYWLEKILEAEYSNAISSKIGHLRSAWKDHYHLDLNTIVHTNLFRILNSYLDQGIAMKKFPYTKNGFLESMRELERNSLVSFLKTKRAKELLFSDDLKITYLLNLLVGDESLFEQYLFDQQFAHPGWSGLVSNIEDNPLALIDERSISLKELITFELLLELDNLDNSLGKKWSSLSDIPTIKRVDVLEETVFTELDEVLAIWQEAFEWTYYDQVLAGIKINPPYLEVSEIPSFQAFFCIDDRECSIRRHIEHFDPKCSTYGTPGHFAIDTYYQPKGGLFYTKVCPAPITPKHLIKEVTSDRQSESDLHFNKNSHSLISGFLISQTLGFWSALKLMVNIFMPSASPASSTSFGHMDQFSTLIVENRSPKHVRNGLQIGYTIDEMVDRVESVLKSTGVITNFSPIVYIIGHGASSTNNTHYAGYDCGACSGRPGSANARAFSYMANHKEVRNLLKSRGISIPESTEFLGGLHDTTRDEFRFYDEELLSPQNLELHQQNQQVFKKALLINAKERSRRFMTIDSKDSLESIHEKVLQRSVSLFEPRPELNHATNALCIIGRKQMNHHLFLDRRSFLNTYDYKIDPTGKFLLGIVNAAAPVCGGINLEYYFSRVDNEKLGAGSKLPHNVMGLIGVANGFEGDLRPGLPIQMVEVHDPIRLMMVIEHFPEVVLKTIQQNHATYEWFINEWVVLTVLHPETKEIYRFRNGVFEIYEPILKNIRLLVSEDLEKVFETQTENLPVYHLS